MDYSQIEQTIITITFFTLNIISFLSCFLVFILYIKKPNLRKDVYKLILFLQISDAIYSFDCALSIFNTYKYEEFCKIQAFVLNWFDLSSLIWTMIIARCIHLSIKEEKNIFDIQKNLNKLLTIAFVVPCLVSIIPFGFDDYGNSNNICWIKKSDENIRRKSFTFLFLYLEIWIAIFYNIYVSILIRQYLKKNKHILQDKPYSEFKKISYVPFVLIFCWTFASINNIFHLLGIFNFSLTLLHILFTGLNGLLNTIFYALNDDVKYEIKSILGCIRPENEVLENELLVSVAEADAQV